jgi:hypothetical protein
MRNRLQWAVTSVLLAAQATTSFPGFVAASAQSPSTADVPSQLEVSINTKNSNPIVFKNTAVPNYDSEVVIPLRAKQAEEAKAAAQVAAIAAQAKAAEAARIAVAKTAAARVVHTITTVSASLPAGSHSDWMATAGIASSDYGFVDYIIDHESGWGVTKSNYGGSGAYGLGQALPAAKMASFGSDYMTSPITQLKWANSYAVGRYGSWAAAYGYWTSHHNW